MSLPDHPDIPAAADTAQAAHHPSLQGRHVFVTGGATGIGAAVVAAFARQGARVAFVDVAAQAAEALSQQLAAEGHARPWWRTVDVKDIGALQAAIADATAALGDVGVLVNNVASDDRHTLESVTPDYFDERMAVNQRPALFAVQAVVPGMRRLGGGSVINFGSIGWQTKNPDYPCYAIAKSSVHGLTRGLAASLGKDRIRINTLTPGWVMTERQVRLWLDAAGEQEIAHNQCLPDKLLPHHVASMVLFLASDDSAMCTAQEFVVDGGWT
ncbi:SDR family oxidoreductase [Hydrogenophaga sp.]|uniref:SDR family NAD(P)-dependent oxidoreductase n=1 Tax=Hydrogenophaga sp. TaxID=1904254 RepID=UPI00286E8265|nr:SDR family oxidoreductase [Hydrogenophaga sp.]